MVSGMPSIVNIDENNICNIVVENCAPYNVTLERDNILGVMETEQDELVPLTDDFISSILYDNEITSLIDIYFLRISFTPSEPFRHPV